MTYLLPRTKFLCPVQRYWESQIFYLGNISMMLTSSSIAIVNIMKLPILTFVLKCVKKQIFFVFVLELINSVNVASLLIYIKMEWLAILFVICGILMYFKLSWSSCKIFHGIMIFILLQLTKSCRRTQLKTSKLLQFMELHGNTISSSKGKCNFKEEVQKSQASCPMVC